MSKETKKTKKVYGSTVEKITIGRREDILRIVFTDGNILEVSIDRYERALNISVTHTSVL
jgi:hypothetical protein